MSTDTTIEGPPLIKHKTRSFYGVKLLLILIVITMALMFASFFKEYKKLRNTIAIQQEKLDRLSQIVMLQQKSADKNKIAGLVSNINTIVKDQAEILENIKSILERNQL